MEAKDMMFGENINGTDETGIFYIENNKPKILCLCTKKNADIIINKFKQSSGQIVEGGHRKETADKWISVKDGLPENQDGKCFLVMVKTLTQHNIDVAEWFNPDIEGEANSWHCCKHLHGRGYSFEVTHWMPLPEPPIN